MTLFRVRERGFFPPRARRAYYSPIGPLAECKKLLLPVILSLSLSLSSLRRAAWQVSIIRWRGRHWVYIGTFFFAASGFRKIDWNARVNKATARSGPCGVVLYGYAYMMVYTRRDRHDRIEFSGYIVHSCVARVNKAALICINCQNYAAKNNSQNINACKWDQKSFTYFYVRYILSCF